MGTRIPNTCVYVCFHVTKTLPHDHGDGATYAYMWIKIFAICISIFDAFPSNINFPLYHLTANGHGFQNTTFFMVKLMLFVTMILLLFFFHKKVWKNLNKKKEGTMMGTHLARIKVEFLWPFLFFGEKNCRRICTHRLILMD